MILQCYNICKQKIRSFVQIDYEERWVGNVIVKLLP